MRGIHGLAWLATLVLCFAAGVPATAAEPTPAMRSAPADAGFYFSWLRSRQLVEQVVKSRAYQTLAELPAVQEGWAKLKEAWKEDEDYAEFRELWDDPNFQEALPLLTEMLGEEVVVFGDGQFEKLLKLQKEYNLISWRVMIGALKQGLGGGGDDVDPEKVTQDTMRAMVDLVHRNLDVLRAPTMVAACRIRDKALAAKQLSKLEAALRPKLEEIPELKDRLQRQKIGADELLALTLDGSMIPWDKAQAEIEKLRLRPDQIAAIQTRITAEKLVVALGVRGDYVVAMIGPSTDVLAKWDAQPAGKSLADSPAFQRLKDASGDLVGVYYASAGMLRGAAYTEADFDAILKLLDEEVPWQSIPDGQEGQRVQSDVHELFADIKAVYPKLGESFAYSLWTARGLETWSYAQIEPVPFDSSRPLSLLEHAGGKPLMLGVSRSSWKPGTAYIGLMKWYRILWGYFEDFGLPLAPEETKKTYDELAQIQPAWDRFDGALRKQFFPALGDGEWSFVLSPFPASEKAETSLLQGFPAPAIVLAVKDAPLLEKAMAEIAGSVEDLAKAVGKLQPEEAAKVKIPPPTLRETPVGKIYTYSTEVEGLTVSLHAGLGKDAAVLSLSPAQTEVLLARQKLEVGGELVTSNRPAGAVSYWSWAALVDVCLAHPTIKAALEQAVADAANGAEASQFLTGLKATRAFRSGSLRSWQEGKTLVQHALWEFQDE